MLVCGRFTFDLSNFHLILLYMSTAVLILILETSKFFNKFLLNVANLFLSKSLERLRFSTLHFLELLFC
jgi:hypothetical protein